MKEIYTVEYSETQKSYHLDTLGRVIEINKAMFYKGKTNDYQIIGAYETPEAAWRSVEYFKEERKDLM